MKNLQRETLLLNQTVKEFFKDEKESWTQHSLSSIITWMSNNIEEEDYYFELLNGFVETFIKGYENSDSRIKYLDDIYNRLVKLSSIRILPVLLDEKENINPEFIDIKEESEKVYKKLHATFKSTTKHIHDELIVQALDIFKNIISATDNSTPTYLSKTAINTMYYCINLVNGTVYVRNNDNAYFEDSNKLLDYILKEIKKVK